MGGFLITPGVFLCIGNTLWRPFKKLRISWGNMWGKSKHVEAREVEGTRTLADGPDRPTDMHGRGLKQSKESLRLVADRHEGEKEGCSNDNA